MDACVAPGIEEALAFVVPANTVVHMPRCSEPLEDLAHPLGLAYVMA